MENNKKVEIILNKLGFNPFDTNPEAYLLGEKAVLESLEEIKKIENPFVFFEHPVEKKMENNKKAELILRYLSEPLNDPLLSIGFSNPNVEKSVIKALEEIDNIEKPIEVLSENPVIEEKKMDEVMNDFKIKLNQLKKLDREISNKLPQNSDDLDLESNPKHAYYYGIQAGLQQGISAIQWFIMKKEL